MPRYVALVRPASALVACLAARLEGVGSDLRAAHDSVVSSLSQALAFSVWPIQSGDDPANRTRLAGSFLRALNN